MPRASDVALEAKLAKLRGTPALAEVRDALRAQTGLIVAAAAARLGDHPALFDEVGAAFDRLCEKAQQRDPGCRGKLALVTALYEHDRWDEVFTRAVRYVQPWSGADSAAETRGLCGMAYAHFARPDALDVLAELLADPERATRAAAASALGNAGRIDASALLRFKLLVGDEEPLVLSACFESLLAIAKDDAFAFVVRFLDGRDQRAEVAVLALATSRQDGAHAAIAAWCDRVLAEQRRRVGYLALALLRLEAATEELLAVIADGDSADSAAAASALGTFREDDGLRARVDAATERRRERRRS